jgi:acetyl esterase
MGERRETLRETGWFPSVYKFFVTIGEWLIKPILNLDAPPVRTHVRDVPYVDGTANRKQRLDVVVPEGDGPFPLLVFVHGGGFISMDKSNYTRIAKSFAAAGYLVFNVNYRRAPSFRYPANLTDVGSAVAWALANAPRYGGDPGKVFLAGDSAGAHLVSTYATALFDQTLARAFKIEDMARPEKVAGLILFYGAFDCDKILETRFPFVRLMMESLLSRDPVVFKERAKNASPIRHIKPGYPPCFVTYAARDRLAPESAAFAEELELEGIEHETLVIPPGECKVIAHGFVSTFWRRCAREVMAAAIDFMRRHA